MFPVISKYFAARRTKVMDEERIAQEGLQEVRNSLGIDLMTRRLNEFKIRPEERPFD
jgi:hypothetical protein